MHVCFQRLAAEILGVKLNKAEIEQSQVSRAHAGLKDQMVKTHDFGIVGMPSYFEGPNFRSLVFIHWSNIAPIIVIKVHSY